MSRHTVSRVGDLSETPLRAGGGGPGLLARALLRVMGAGVDRTLQKT